MFGSGAPSSAGRVSGGRSVGVGLPSACSSLGVFRFDGECLLLVQVDLNEITFKMEDRNTTVKHSVRIFFWKMEKHDELKGIRLWPMAGKSYHHV